jgi:hypothetical protein
MTGAGHRLALRCVAIPGDAARIVNSPHPVIFQKSLIENAEQRAARNTSAHSARPASKTVEAKGDWFFDHLPARRLEPRPDAERRQYCRLVQVWSLQRDANWYRLRGWLSPPEARSQCPTFCCAHFPRLFGD